MKSVNVSHMMKTLKFIPILLIIIQINLINAFKLNAKLEKNSKSILEHRMHPEFNGNVEQMESKQQSNNDDELTTDYWINNAKDFVDDQVKRLKNKNIAKNVIMFLGDGMSISTVAATRVYMGGESEYLSFEKFPYIGMSKTYCVDEQTADSACSGTAFLSGVKANDGTLGVNAKVLYADCTAELDQSTHTTSIGKWAIDAGKVAGLVTTTRVTHASPASLYAHSANRDWENDNEIVYSGCNSTALDDIAEQLVYGDVGSQLRVILGCGRGEFLNNNIQDIEGQGFGYRRDGKDLITEWTNNNVIDGTTRTYVWNNTQLKNVNVDETDFLLGLFERSHCAYNLDIEDSENDPTLTDMVDKAIDILSKHDEGYFLFVEGGQIDRAHHDTRAKKSLEETAEFSRSIELALAKVNLDETLIVVTSDHSHTLTYSGYPSRGKNIFGEAGMGNDNLPFLTLSYANGEGFYNNVGNSSRVDLSGTDTDDKNFRFPSTYYRESETHGGDDVVIYATGPWSHLFSGIMEQSNIPYFMAYAACIGDGLKMCD